MTAIIHVDHNTFDDKVLAASHTLLVLLDISAEWCGPCKVIEPILEKVSVDYSQQIILAKLEAEDENMKIAGKYGVRGFPTVIAIYQGEEIDRFHGAKPWSFVSEFIETNLAKTKP